MHPRHEYTQGCWDNALRIIQSINHLLCVHHINTTFDKPIWYRIYHKKYKNFSVIEISNQLHPPDLLTAKKKGGIHWSGRVGSIPGCTGNLTPINKPTTNQLSDLLTNLSESINHYKRYKLHMPVSNTVHRKGFSLLK